LGAFPPGRGIRAITEGGSPVEVAKAFKSATGILADKNT